MFYPCTKISWPKISCTMVIKYLQQPTYILSVWIFYGTTCDISLFLANFIE
ncbi:MAG: hypothetical protein GFH27_549279n288 [Chloroflexi bacterium AL-W]|nr:hypothetical protein [Chloroflexi bacterium AL-N1]NOK65254.1 hypothetical protein [Chloroflexi bacterium AL-N10]NOK72481.1 hypothetical protein [Chloroflexi bacterium AL-N5]NOK79433.1 hypothetical protein [Chloroflexi bacterium AL-W]NOK87349.1 hypothetical protein [Chloroflexi bacterium AL-N15]